MFKSCRLNREIDIVECENAGLRRKIKDVIKTMRPTDAKGEDDTIRVKVSGTVAEHLGSLYGYLMYSVNHFNLSTLVPGNDCLFRSGIVL